MESPGPRWVLPPTPTTGSSPVVGSQPLSSSTLSARPDPAGPSGISGRTAPGWGDPGMISDKCGEPPPDVRSLGAACESAARLEEAEAPPGGGPEKTRPQGAGPPADRKRLRACPGPLWGHGDHVSGSRPQGGAPTRAPENAERVGKASGAGGSGQAGALAHSLSFVPVDARAPALPPGGQGPRSPL